jgi:hypothetical protein
MRPRDSRRPRGWMWCRAAVAVDRRVRSRDFRSVGNAGADGDPNQLFRLVLRNVWGTAAARRPGFRYARRLQQPRSGFSFGHAPDGKEPRRARGSHPAKALVVFPPPNDASDPGDFGTPMVPRSNSPSPTDQPRSHSLAGILKSAPERIRTSDLRFRRPRRRGRLLAPNGNYPCVRPHSESTDSRQVLWLLGIPWGRSGHYWAGRELGVAR